MILWFPLWQHIISKVSVFIAYFFNMGAWRRSMWNWNVNTPSNMMRIRRGAGTQLAASGFSRGGMSRHLSWSDFSSNLPIYFHVFPSDPSIMELFDPFARQMVKNAIAWARANKKVRSNVVHGAEEFRLATFESFQHKERERTTTTASVEADLEDTHLQYPFQNIWVGCYHIVSHSISPKVGLCMW